ncbi:MAG TPA: hypothetical protein VFZ03_00225, partial [Dongiaceae bacterium]
MSSQNGAVRQPAGDLSAFDLSKRSPEDIARLFARWKQQRKALQVAQQAVREPAKASKPHSARFMPSVARSRAAQIPEPQQPGSHSLRYSAPFAAVLEADANVAQDVRLRKLQFGAAVGATARLVGPTHVPAEPLPRGGAVRSSRSRWVLAGAASILAVAAASGAVLWNQMPSVRAGWTHSEPVLPVTVAPSAPTQADTEAVPVADPTAARMAARLLPAATQVPKAAPWPWPMAVDVALMQPASPANEIMHARLAPRLKPQQIAVRTASQGTQEPPPIETSGLEIKSDKVLPAVRNPSAVSVAIPAASTPRSRTEDEVDSGTNPESVHRRGNDKEVIGLGDADKGSKRGAHGHDGTGTSSAGSAAPGGSAGSSGGSSTSGGSDNSGGSGASGGTSGGDTGSSGGTGGAGAGGGSTGGGDTGSGTGGSAGGGDTGSGTGGSTGGGDTGGGDTGGSDTGGSTGGGDTGGNSGGGDTGGGDTGGSAGGGDTGGGDTGGGDTGGGDTGGSTGGGDTGGGNAGGG